MSPSVCRYTVCSIHIYMQHICTYIYVHTDMYVGHYVYCISVLYVQYILYIYIWYILYILCNMYICIHDVSWRSNTSYTCMSVHIYICHIQYTSCVHSMYRYMSYVYDIYVYYIRQVYTQYIYSYYEYIHILWDTVSISHVWHWNHVIYQSVHRCVSQYV